MTPSTPDTPSRLDAAAAIAAAIIVAVLVFKATSTLDPFPGWSGDPTLVAAPILAITPTFSIVADLVLSLAATVAIAIAAPRLLRGTRHTPIAGAVLLLLILATTLPHLRTAHHDPQLALTLSAWLSALLAGLAAFALHTFPRARAILAAGVVALIAALVARALVQFFIEQPATYATFKATKSAFLAAQGWPEGSPNALAYERRVSQREASAWFGMANVLASYGAAFAACFATWTIAALARPGASARARVTLIACTLASVALVLMAGSKGGYAALLLGLLLASIAAWRSSRTTDASSRTHRAALLLGPSLVLLALAAILLRGVLGERLSELSLLFRWHYLLGASRTFLESPLVGVSPTGFKDAYLRLKPPTSPEDVSSPHSVFFDLITGLGVVGIFWSLLAMAAAARAGRFLVAPTPPPDPHAPHSPHARHAPRANRQRDPLAATAGARPVFLALALGTIAAAWSESAAVTPEAALVRIISILGGMSVAGLALRTHERAPRLFAMGLAAAALTILVHAQIELTWAILTSAPLFATILGLGAGGILRTTEPISTPRPHSTTSRLALAAAAIPGIASLLLIAFLLPNVATWESSLRRAYAQVAPLASLNDRLQALASATRTRDPIARDLASALGAELLPPAQAKASFTFADLTGAYSRFRLDRMTAALDDLKPAQVTATRHVETQRAISSLALRLFLERGQIGDAAGASDAAGLAIRTATAAASSSPNSATAASWVATVCRTLAQTPGALVETDLGPPRQVEIRFLLKAAELAPYEPSHAAWLAEAYASQGDPANAATWAAEALRRDTLLRLDPIRKFEPARRTRMESLAKPAQPKAPPPPPQAFP